jgi:hypothetical protein
LSLSAASVNRDAKLPLAVREKLAEQRSRRAVILLGRAAKAGFFSAAARAAHLDKDSDLAFLRQRDDYRRFRAGLDAVKGKGE